MQYSHERECITVNSSVNTSHGKDDGLQTFNKRTLGPRPSLDVQTSNLSAVFLYFAFTCLIIVSNSFTSGLWQWLSKTPKHDAKFERQPLLNFYSKNFFFFFFLQENNKLYFWFFFFYNLIVELYLVFLINLCIIYQRQRKLRSVSPKQFPLKWLHSLHLSHSSPKEDLTILPNDEKLWENKRKSTQNH